jgi:hypothetical protein
VGDEFFAIIGCDAFKMRHLFQQGDHSLRNQIREFAGNMA